MSDLSVPGLWGDCRHQDSFGLRASLAHLAEEIGEGKDRQQGPGSGLLRLAAGSRVLSAADVASDGAVRHRFSDRLAQCLCLRSAANDQARRAETPLRDRGRTGGSLICSNFSLIPPQIEQFFLRKLYYYRDVGTIGQVFDPFNSHPRVEAHRAAKDIVQVAEHLADEKDLYNAPFLSFP